MIIWQSLATCLDLCRLMLLPSSPFISSEQTKPVLCSRKWWSHYRDIGTATVTLVDLSPQVDHEMSAVSWLDEDEHLRWQRYLHLGARRRFAMCRAALRSILCRQLACQNEQLAFGVSQHGKPFALVDNVAATINFNVSHSGNQGLIAFAPAGQLGVDVEEYKSRRSLDQLAKSDSLFNLNERTELAQVSGDDKVQLFNRLWTIKEALLKALGTGLRKDIAKIAVPLGLLRGTTGIYRFPHKPMVAWRVEYIGNSKFAASVVQEII